MMAMNRGLLYSGVQNIISTLFVVNDETTYQLMRFFYEYLLEGAHIRIALASAKRKFLIENPNVLPIHWASFVLVGD